MLEKLYPKMLWESAYTIPYDKLYEEGYRGILYDIDNTLVPHGAPADERAKELFQRLHAMGFQTMLLSNNKEPRVKSFAEAVHSSYIFKAGKPGVRGYQKGIDALGLKTEEVIFVGDQIFTDIWGANRVGLYTFLTHPIHHKEEIQIVLKRIPEKLILYFYKKRKVIK